MTRLGIVSIVIDAARQRAARPLGEFLQRPRMPIRSMYLYRLFTNMVWYARNYLNMIVGIVALMSVWYPLFAVCLVSSVLVHINHASPRSIWFKAVQLAACVWNYFEYGVWPPVVAGLIVVTVLFSHALLTPYTDDASALYESLVKPEGVEAFPAPSTPVTEYEGTNQFGPHQLQSPPRQNLTPPKPILPSILKEKVIIDREKDIPFITTGEVESPMQGILRDRKLEINLPVPGTAFGAEREAGPPPASNGEPLATISGRVAKEKEPRERDSPLVGAGKKRKTAVLVKAGEEVFVGPVASSLPLDVGSHRGRRLAT